MFKPVLVRLTAGAAAPLLLLATPGSAQVQTVDPSSAMQAQGSNATYDNGPVPVSESPAPGVAAAGDTRTPPPESRAPSDTPPSTATLDSTEATYQDDDIFGAAEGVFGKGAEGLAKMLEKVLKEQGRPNAYIAGREAGGAFAVGVRYGSGTLHHKVEGDQPIYWTGPSLGFDIGANGAKTFVLVYNLYDSQDLMHRFPQAEGNVYVIGGFTASYLRRGDIVIIPIRLGVGWRLGANVGYMNFSKKAKWVPF